jgi:enamine deaminase RidA (YjgF/YER057c/UK114 family)
MRLFDDHNEVWNEWVDPQNPPVRAYVRAELWRPNMLVEIMVTASR